MGFGRLATASVVLALAGCSRESPTPRKVGTIQVEAAQTAEAVGLRTEDGAVFVVERGASVPTRGQFRLTPPGGRRTVPFEVVAGPELRTLAHLELREIPDEAGNIALGFEVDAKGSVELTAIRVSTRRPIELAPVARD